MVVAFLAVGREGLETALILWTATRTATGRDLPEAATTTAAADRRRAGHRDRGGARLLRLQGCRPINLTRFFTWTGALLVLVAAGVLSYGMHDLQEAGVLPGLDNSVRRQPRAVEPGSLLGDAAQGDLQLLPGDHVGRGRWSGSRTSPS